MRGSLRAAAAGALVLPVVLAGAGPADAQEPLPGERACTLVLEPATDSTRSTTVQVGEDQYVTYVGNGLRWTCGDARMYADSAVKYDRERRLKAIGSVDYRDSLRTLTSDTLTYHERSDRLVARGRAVLRQRETGSVLSGPRIEFLRAVSAVDRRTLATGRPHMEVRAGPSRTDSAAPTGVDADSILLVGRSEARTWGDVEIARPDLEATADSAFFFVDRGVGRLYGSPKITGRSFTLTGDSIRTGTEAGELRSVVAWDSARATGEGFQLLARVIRVRLADRQVDRMWAHGEGRSVALAPPYRLAADSLAFGFRAGRLDTLRAVTGAEAVEVGDSVEGDPWEPIPLAVGERSWLSADTLTMVFADEEREPGADTAGPEGRAPPAPGGASDTSAAVAAADTAGAGPPGTAVDTADGTGGSRIRRVRAVGSARAYRVLAGDGAGEAAAGSSPSRHYQRGRVIVVHFRDGQAHRVVGEQAVGVHLDPAAGAAGAPGPARDTAAGAGPAAATRDSMAGPDRPADADTVRADTVRAAPDSTRAAPDSAGAGPGRERGGP